MVTITQFFDPATSTFSYVVFDPQTRDAIVIDPVLNYDPLSSSITFASLGRIRDYLDHNDLKIHLILDTHIHADHMTGAFFLKRHFGVKTAIGEHFLISQKYFADIFQIEPAELQSPVYDLLLKHEEVLSAGSLLIKILHVPGHTPSCSAYLIEDSLFCGDALFQPELGCGRADFPGGNAHSLYNSIKNIIYALPDNTKIYVGHDYPSSQEEPKPSTTVGESKQKNIMLDQQISEADFVLKREGKDQTLQPPKLLWPAMQVNILGGQLPKADFQGRAFLRIPLTVKD